ncbi:hypothetical protein VC83_04307 [Pseudogymnoascus destructans]|uniref:Uncharacterized protein n=2 Tax=Pseudogymnoascus destructans TaxID=655981 RepID=L8FRT7_PSED2|nr:uncharacterized protein VC83_04307 [Pseudogymnoascus destructans]ELR02431.1 hypothetical protein GMDG_05489 [Pseudogymnoascus destructans 20631-21]OAF59119.1 hypothetical protein VC83_04307 [Pseudogymnoascus destructans]
MDQATDNEEEDTNTRLFRASKHGREDLVTTLLQKGVMPDRGQYENLGHTALTITCSKGHEGIVQLLLDHGADINAKNQDSDRTPLFWAAGSGHASVVKLLLEAGAEPNGAEENGRTTPLAVAAVRGHEDAVWALLEWEGDGVDIDRKGFADRRTVLSHSAEDGQELIVTRLLDRGADPDSRDLRGWTPLCWAAQRGQVAIVEILLARGADPNSGDEKHCIFVESPGDRTPLLYAAAEGHGDVVRLLLQNGAEVNHCDRGKWSALGRAVFNGRVEVVNVLLDDGGADPEIGGILGDTLLKYAEMQLWGREEPRYSTYVEIIGLLQKWSRKGEPVQASGVLERLYAMWR